MTYTPIPKGTENWDVPVNAAFESQDTRLSVAEDDLVTQAAAIGSNAASINALYAQFPEGPQARGFINWNYRPEGIVGSTAHGNGFILTMRVWVQDMSTVSNLWISINTVGSGLTAGQNFLGLYDANGNRLGLTADLTSAWAADTDLHGYPLTTPVTIGAGAYYVAMVSNGSTRPAIWRSISNAAAANTINAGRTAETQDFGYFPTVNASLPATLDFSTRTPLITAPWVAIS